MCAPLFIELPGYACHHPEATLLYKLVEQHYPAFRELRAAPRIWRRSRRCGTSDAISRCGTAPARFPS
jgi:hypothetical protein